MIDFATEDSTVLLNPRLPEGERDRLERLRSRLPELPGHVWVTTSGSSGPLKLVAISKRAFLASAEAVNAHLAASASDVWCRPLPLFHVGGLGIHARAFLSGSRVVELAGWSGGDFANLVRREGVTLASLVPAQVGDLARERIPSPPSLRAVVVGGGALPEELRLAARELQWPLLPSYGMTETASQVATAELGSERSLSAPRLRLLGHVQARAEPALAFRSPALFTGYGIEDRGTPRFVDPKVDGWFISEDEGSVEKEGEITYVDPRGRSSDFVKVGGESVSLSRLDGILEAVLRRFRGVDAAVFAAPDARLGSVIHLAVSDERRSGDVSASFASEVLPFERPRGVYVVEIPRSPLGKIRREELRRRALGEGR